jgi:hypothetical protein
MNKIFLHATVLSAVAYTAMGVMIQQKAKHMILFVEHKSDVCICTMSSRGCSTHGELQ